MRVSLRETQMLLSDGDVPDRSESEKESKSCNMSIL
jgi:hypothetical protein